MKLNGVRVLLADDHAMVRLGFRLLLEGAGASVIGEADCGESAVRLYAESNPDVVVMDVSMPGVGGLDVARAAVAQGGLVVFTTAYDDYAIRAFEAGAVDYLLKPVQPARLEQAVERLRMRLDERRGGDPGAGLQALIDGLESRLRPRGERLIRWISASAGDSVRMFGIEDVLFFQAQEKYVRVVAADGEGVIRTPLKELLAGLDPDEFWQVHRGTVVRVRAIERVSKNELGRHGLSLKGHSERLPVSGAFLHRFRGM